MDNDVGLVDGFAGFQGQKVRVASACADEINVACFCGGHDVPVEEGLKSGEDASLAMGVHRGGACGEVEFRPEGTAFGAHRQHFDGVAKVLAGSCECAERGGQGRF